MYSFDKQYDKWETLADVYDVFQDELENAKDDTDDVFLDVESFDEYEVL
jgi:hypothetical protein